MKRVIAFDDKGRIYPANGNPEMPKAGDTLYCNDSSFRIGAGLALVDKPTYRKRRSGVFDVTYRFVVGPLVKRRKPKVKK